MIYAIHPDEKAQLQWIEIRLAGIGIDVRQSGEHTAMRYYLDLLQEEIEMTRRCLHDDGGGKP